MRKGGCDERHAVAVLADPGVGRVALIQSLYIKLGLAAALLAVGFAAGSGWQKSTTAKVRQDFAEYRAEQARLNADTRQAALDAERAATAREHDLQAQIETLDKEARDAQAARDTARRAAAVAGDRLRHAIATINYLGNSPDTSATPPSQCSADRLGVIV